MIHGTYCLNIVPWYLTIYTLSGGIRGIIQLKVLEALERKINLGVPIQDFFDLVVGTRYVTT